MNFSLDKLQKVRALREQLAQSDLANGRHRLDQADQELSRKRMHLAYHRLIKSKEEAMLFNAIHGKEVTLDEFKAYCSRLSDLSTAEKKYLEKVKQAETQKDSICADVDRLSDALQKRCRERNKLSEFGNVWNARVEEEKIRWEQEEMEEMVTLRFLYNDRTRVK